MELIAHIKVKSLVAARTKKGTKYTHPVHASHPEVLSVGFDIYDEEIMGEDGTKHMVGLTVSHLDPKGRLCTLGYPVHLADSLEAALSVVYRANNVVSHEFGIWASAQPMRDRDGRRDHRPFVLAMDMGDVLDAIDLIGGVRVEVKGTTDMQAAALESRGIPDGARVDV